MAGALGGFMAGSIIAKLLLDKTRWNASINEVSTKDKNKLVGSFSDIGKQAKQFGLAIAGAGLAATTALIAIVKSTANAGDAFYDLSQRTGISTEILSAFKLAADKSGTSIEGFATGMKGLSRVMGEAVSGSKEAQAAFDDIGVKATTTTGELRPLDQVMLDVADRFAAMEDGAAKNALAMKLFGRAGMDLIPMLNLGRKGLEDEAEAARKLGLVFSTEAAKACDKFNDRLIELKGAFAGVRNEIAIAVMPIMTKFVTFFRDAVVELRGKIEKLAESGKLQEWAISIGRAFISGFKVAAMAVGGLVEAIYFLQGVVFSVGEELMRSMAKWTQGIMLTINIAARAIPGLKGIARDVTEAWKSLVLIGMEYGKKADQSYEKTADLVSVFDSFKKILDKASKAIGDVGKETEKAGKKISSATQAARGFGTAITETVIPAARNLSSALKLAPGTFADIEWEAPTKAVEGFAETTRSTMQEVSTIVSDAMRNVGRAIVDAFGISEALTYKAKEFNNEYFEGALAAVQKDYEARKDSIGKNIMDEEERSAALNELNEWYKAETDRIRTDEDRAREEHAKREEARQGSLWNKVKGIFGTAVEEMLTVWTTRFLTDIGQGFLDLIKPAKEAGKGITDTLGSAIKGIGTGIKGLLTGLGEGIAGMAKAIAGAAKEILIAAGVALAIYAGFSVVKGLLDKAFGGGKESSDVTYWLKPMSEHLQVLRNYLEGGFGGLLSGDIIRALWNTMDLAGHIYDLTANDLDHLGDRICDGLGGVIDAIKNIPGGQHGAIITGSGLMAVHGMPSRPEIIIPLPDLGRFISGQRTDNQAVTREINIKNEVHIDGVLITDREYTRTRLMPEIIEALSSNLLKSKIQQALGV